MEGLGHAGSGLGAALCGGLLLAQPGRTQVHAAFARLLVGLGLAMALKGVSWLIGPEASPWLLRWGLFGLAVFPLLAALFVEQLRHRHLPRWAKLYFLAGSLLLGATSLMPSWVALKAWHVAFSSYVVCGVVILSAWLFRAWRVAPKGPRRALLGGVLVAGAVAPLFIVSDLREEVGLSLPRMGSVPLLLLTFYGSDGLHRVGAFQLRRGTLRLVALVAVAVVAALACGLGAGLTGAQTFTCGLILALGLVLLEPLRGLLRRQQAERSELVFERLSLLPTTSPEALAGTLRAWPEVARVVEIPLTDAAAAERARLEAWRLAHGGLVERTAVLREHLTTREHDALLTLEQLQLLLDSHDAEYALPWGPDHLLGLSLEPGVDRRLYGPALKVIVGMSERLWARLRGGAP